ncbi:MAG: endonuclease III domain-containing protein [Candidatus Diapherotrites archaeon]
MKPIFLYKKLYSSFGLQGWWPAERTFEVCVGAILTQNTSWGNVEKALNNLKKEKRLDAKKISAMKNKELAELIRPAGYYNQKASYLKEFCLYLKKYNFNLNKFFSKKIPELRKELLSIKGIGPETADSMILYAAEKPVFVVDAYTKRIINRLYNRKYDDYNKLQEFFHENLPEDAGLFNEFHALLVRLGKDYCRKKKPLCRECPLRKECSF